jgi:hypothetical protein
MIGAAECSNGRIGCFPINAIEDSSVPGVSFQQVGFDAGSSCGVKECLSDLTRYAFPPHPNIGIAGGVVNDYRFDGADQELTGGEAIADDIELSLPTEAEDVGLSVVLVG